MKLFVFKGSERRVIAEWFLDYTCKYNKFDKAEYMIDYLVTNGLGYDLIEHSDGEEGLQRHLKVMELKSKKSDIDLTSLVLNEFINGGFNSRKDPIIVGESPAEIQDFQKSLEILKTETFHDDKVHEDVPYNPDQKRKNDRKLPNNVKSYMNGSSVGRSIRRNFQRKTF